MQEEAKSFSQDMRRHSFEHGCAVLYSILGRHDSDLAFLVKANDLVLTCNVHL